MPEQDSTIRLIPLTQGKFALVDASDYDFLIKFRWRAQYVKGKNYWRARRNAIDPKTNKRCTILMHRQILNAPSRVQVDHADGDGLHNWRANLRLATNSQNGCNSGVQKNNSSGYKGVMLQDGRWRSRIAVDGKHIHLGYFDSAMDAASAYDRAAKQYHGPFARLNFPDVPDRSESIMLGRMAKRIRQDIDSATLAKMREYAQHHRRIMIQEANGIFTEKK